MVVGNQFLQIDTVDYGKRTGVKGVRAVRFINVKSEDLGSDICQLTYYFINILIIITIFQENSSRISKYLRVMHVTLPPPGEAFIVMKIF
jgi:hypothetical protein